MTDDQAAPLPDTAVRLAAIQHVEYRGFTDPQPEDFAIAEDMLAAAAPALYAQERERLLGGPVTRIEPDPDAPGYNRGVWDIDATVAQARAQGAAGERERLQHRVNALLARHDQLPVWLRREIAGLTDGETDD